MLSHTHRYVSVSTPLYYFSNSEGCDRKLCKNNEQDASLFIPIITWSYRFQSPLSINCARRYQWACNFVDTLPQDPEGLDSLEALIMLKHRTQFHQWSQLDRSEAF